MQRPNESTAWRLDNDGNEIKQDNVCQAAYDADDSTAALVNCGMPAGKNKYEIIWFYNLDKTEYVEQVTLKLRAISSLCPPPELMIRSYYPLPADSDPINDPGTVLGSADIPVAGQAITKVIKIPKTRICDLRVTFRAVNPVNANVIVYDIGFGGIGGLGGSVFFIL